MRESLVCVKKEGAELLSLGRREIINPQKKRLSCQAFREAMICCLGARTGRFGAMGLAQHVHLDPQPCSWGPLWMRSPESTAGWRRMSPTHQRAALCLYNKLQSCLLSKSWGRPYRYGGNTAWSREYGDFFYLFLFFLLPRGRKGGVGFSFCILV